LAIGKEDDESHSVCTEADAASDTPCTRESVIRSTTAFSRCFSMLLLLLSRLTRPRLLDEERDEGLSEEDADDEEEEEEEEDEDEDLEEDFLEDFLEEADDDEEDLDEDEEDLDEDDEDLDEDEDEEDEDNEAVKGDAEELSEADGELDLDDDGAVGALKSCSACTMRISTILASWPLIMRSCCAASLSGLMRFGPHTMAKLWVVIMFTSLCLDTSAKKTRSNENTARLAAGRASISFRQCTRSSGVASAFTNGS